MAVTFRFLQAAAVSVVFLSLCVHAAETPLVALSSVLKRANAVSAPASDRGGGANPIASDIGSRVDAGGAANVAAAASALPMSPPHDTYRASEGLSDSSAQAFILFSETAKSGLQSALDGSEWALRNRQVVFRNAATESWQIVYTPATPLAIAVDSVGNRVWVATIDGLGFIAILGAKQYHPFNSVVALQIAVHPDDGRLAAYSDGAVQIFDPSASAITTPYRLAPVGSVDAIRFDVRNNRLLLDVAGSVMAMSWPCCEAQPVALTRNKRDEAALEYIPISMLRRVDGQTDPTNRVRFLIEIRCDGLERCDASDRYLRTLSISTFAGGSPMAAQLIGVDAAGVVTLELPFAPSATSFVTIRAVDPFGRTSNAITLPALDYQKANVAPTVAVTVPAANQVFTLPTAIVLKATASDNDGTIAKVEFFRGGTTLLGVGTLSAGVYSYSWTTATAGSYSITAKATDNAGGSKISTAVAMVVNAPPTITLESPTNAATYNPPATITLRAAAADSDGTIGKVEFFSGTTLIGAGTLSSGKYIAAWANAPAGSYSIVAKATDNRGAVATSAASAITVCAAPTIAWSTPASGSVINLATPAATGTAVSLTATASVPAACGSVGKVEFYSGTTLLGNGTPIAGSFNFLWANVVPGTYNVKARAYLNTSATFAESTTVSLIVNRPPAVTLDTPLDGATFVSPANITLSATATDDGSISKVEFIRGTAVIATASLMGGKYTVNWANVGAGSYVINARATDNRGAITTSAASSIVVSSCSLPAVAMAAPANGAIVNLAGPDATGVTVSLTATASLPLGCGGVGKVEFYSGTMLLGAGVLVGTQYVYTWTNVSPRTASLSGTYSVKARAYVGATAAYAESPAVSFEVNRPPYVTMNWISDTPIEPATVAISARAHDEYGSIAKVEFLQNGTFFSPGALQGADTYVAEWASVPKGDYSITARATDNRGAITISAPTALNVRPIPANVAAGKPTRQSSTLASSTSDLAVDGALGATSQTTVEDFPWWEVDLGQGYDVSSIELSTLASCCGAALADLWIVMSAAPIAPLAGSQLALQQSFGDLSSTSDTFAFSASASAGTTTAINVSDARACCGKSKPRYVRIWSRVASSQLAFNEVRVRATSPATATPFPSAYAGARLSGAADGSTLVAGNPTLLSTVPQRSTSENVSFAVTSVEYFDGTKSLGTVAIAPYNYALIPTSIDYKLRARVLWSDGIEAWTNDVRVRGQALSDIALRISSPLTGGWAYAGDEGIPGYFMLRGSWVPDTTSRLEYLLECIPACITAQVWQPVKQIKGASFQAMVQMPDFTYETRRLTTKHRITVRATLQSGAVAMAASEFSASQVRVDLSGPTLVEGASATVQGTIVGLASPARRSQIGFMFDQVYVSDGEISEQVSGLSYPDTAGAPKYWQGVCGSPNRNGYVGTRQYYLGTPGAVTMQSDNHFSHPASLVAGGAFGYGEFESTASPNAIVQCFPWVQNGLRGWFRVTARSSIVVPGYKAFGSNSGSNVILRFGAMPPEVSEHIPVTAWIGKPRVWSVIVDYDDSRVPPPSNVKWLANSVEVATATSCGPYLDSPTTHHVFTCASQWINPPVGDYTLQTKVTDLQGHTSISEGILMQVLPWTANFTMPETGLAVQRVWPLHFDASITPVETELALLRDNVVVKTIIVSNGVGRLSDYPRLGAHTYQLRATNPSDGEAFSNIVTLTGVADTVPEVAFTQPAAASSFVAPGTIAISVNASSAGRIVQRVVVRANGTVISTLTAAPFTYRWLAVPLGSYTLIAQATDSAGLTSFSAPITISVTDAPPAPPTVALEIGGGARGFARADVDRGIACITLKASAPTASIRGYKLTFNGVDLLVRSLDQSVSAVNTGACLNAGLALGSYPVTATVTTTDGQNYSSAVLPLIIRDMQVAMVHPPMPGYLTDALPIFEGLPSFFEATASSSGANIARVDLYENFWQPDWVPVLASITAPVAGSAGALWRATWVSEIRTGIRVFAACAFDSDGVRACSLGETWVPLLNPVLRSTVAVTGPTSAAPGQSYRYTVTPTMGAIGIGSQRALTVTNVALFDADTREKLAERAVAPYVFDLSFGRARRVVAALVDENGYEAVSDPLAVASSNVVPMAEISRPITGSEFASGTTIPITVIASDADGSISRIELWQKGDNSAPDTLLASTSATTLTYALLLPNATQIVSLYAYVIDNAGAKIKTATTTLTTRAAISDPRYFVWTNMNAALKAGNKVAAMEFLTSTAQTNYVDVMDDAIAQATAIAASAIASTFAQVSGTDSTADYLVARIINGQRLVFGLRFVLMDDGKWKLDSM